MSVAHWQALQVCGGSIPLAQQCVHDATMLGSLAAMVAAGPLSLALDTGVRQLFRKAWHLMAQASRVELVLGVVSAECRPCLLSLTVRC